MEITKELLISHRNDLELTKSEFLNELAQLEGAIRLIDSLIQELDQAKQPEKEETK